MKLRVLLINPWIYDFAAYNLWSAPLGLLKVAEHLSSFGTDLSFIDCTDSVEIRKYGSGKFRWEKAEKPILLKDIPRLYKRYGIGTDDFIRRVKYSSPADMVLVTCVMSYWYPGVQKVIEIIRDLMGRVPVILGGIYATLYHEHASCHSGADFIYKGPLQQSINFALKTFGFRPKRKGVAQPYYRLNLYETYPFAPILSATGCPFRCPYCASGLLSDSYKRRCPDDVLREIMELCDMGVSDYAFYDDALLFDAEGHIKRILRGVADKGLKARFHTPNGLHARMIDEELAELMRVTDFRTIRLSLETADGRRQKDTGDKVSNNDLERAVRHLRRAGFTKEEVGVYLMYGLPGQPIEEVREGIRFLKGLNVRIQLAEFSPIRGTGAWEELIRHGVIEETLDPVLTNNTVFSYIYSGYDPEAIERIRLEVKEYNLRRDYL